MGKGVRVISGFGTLNDPFTGQLAMHESLDLVVDVGSPIVVTAAVTVTHSAWDASYGNVVEVATWKLSRRGMPIGVSV